jgi:hypothetical protein
LQQFCAQLWASKTRPWQPLTNRQANKAAGKVGVVLAAGVLQWRAHSCCCFCAVCAAGYSMLQPSHLCRVTLVWGVRNKQTFCNCFGCCYSVGQWATGC